MKRRIITIPNTLSFGRLIMIPLLFWLLVSERADLLALAVMALLAVTDWLDGFLARRWNVVTRLGELLDPIADRLYVVTILAALVLREIVPLWLAGTLVARDVVLAGLVLVLASKKRAPLPVNFVGKTATALIFIAFPLLLLGDGTIALPDWVAAISTVLGWASGVCGLVLYWLAGILYLREGRQVLKREAL